jgi:hypothetical protein
MLMAGPLAVVMASVASAWLAVRSDDGLVAQDYYHQGLLINERLQHPARPREPSPGASLRVGADRVLHVRLRNVGDAPERLELALVPHGDRTRGVHLRLARDGDEWVGVLPQLEPGRWVVGLESPAWRLPVTVVELPFTGLELRGPAS